MIQIFALALIFCLSRRGFCVCPGWLKDRPADTPTCPVGSIIPETYPVGAVLVSDSGHNGHDSEFTTNFVTKVLKGSGANTPVILLPVKDDTMKKLKDRIQSLPVSDKQKTVWLASLIQIPAKSYTWQQDYFQSFINPETGQPVLRSVKNYEKSGDSFSKVSAATQECGFTKGPDLVSETKKNGMMGGNIQSLPSGICALGDDDFESDKEWSNYADQFCGKDPNNRIKVPTSWLEVGHTDEIMKTVRNKNNPPPCDFSIVLASPKRAVDLLKKNPNDRFLDFSALSKTGSKDISDRRTQENQGLRKLCLGLKALHQLPDQERTTPQEPSRSTSQLLSFSLGTAWALSAPSKSPDPGDCANVTNSDVLQVLTAKTNLGIYNDLIQKNMDKLKNDVEAKLKQKYPQCTVDIIETPDLFFGGLPVKTEAGYDLPEGLGRSILPNPANAVSINDTVISPEPFNSVFKKYMTEEYQKRGLNAEFVDTYDYAHEGEGNLHCSTHTIHICKPKEQK